MKKVINTDNAPQAIGPYSQAIASGEIVFVSGQLPLDPKTQAFPDGGIKAQSRQSLNNLKAILEASGASLETVIKTTCFLSNFDHFEEFNEVYADVFGTDSAPARSCIQAARLPKNALVEVEAIAFIRK